VDLLPARNGIEEFELRRRSVLSFLKEEERAEVSKGRRVYRVFWKKRSVLSSTI
jgi:hypothetical protein